MCHSYLIGGDKLSERKRENYFQNALSLLLYDYQDCPHKIVEIFDESFTEALKFVFANNRFDRSQDLEQFKQVLLEEMIRIIDRRLKTC